MPEGLRASGAQAAPPIQAASAQTAPPMQAAAVESDGPGGWWAPGWDASDRPESEQ
jgi:hypothetical protein